ncbi:hypothetical protein C1280_36975 [Gemmata obscuriglobus]|uniref:Uncharacterized protein n=1 Tax=Gemmata obscuriglobus TaxID=114 RepID=A0A2Z3H5E8_9BACT|nr:hypothetical protein C1280_36975 [Gemmata obscuriglobus]
MRNRCHGVSSVTGHTRQWQPPTERAQKARENAGQIPRERLRDFSYNFCWPVRTLRVKGENGRWQKRTPAMVAGSTDHVWSLAEWLAYPARFVQRK